MSLKRARIVVNLIAMVTILMNNTFANKQFQTLSYMVDESHIDLEHIYLEFGVS